MTESEFLALAPRERDRLVDRHIFGNFLSDRWGRGNFTTSISAAWTVVEKMREEDWAFTLETEEAGTAFDAHFWEGDTFHYGFADTAPLAICISALRAKEVIE